MRHWLIVVSILLLSACRAETVVAVDVEANGSGVVAVEVGLDEEAVAALPDLEASLRADDLKRSGWTVHPIEETDGMTVIRITQGFEGEASANAVLAQLSSGDGPFRDLRIDQRRSLTGVTTSFNGTVDLTDGVSALGDSTLQSRTGFPLGFDVGEFTQGTGINLEQRAPMTVRFSAPGAAEREVPDTSDGDWLIPYGEVTTLGATYVGLDLQPLGFGLLAALALVAALVILFVTRSGRYRPKHIRQRESGPSARIQLTRGYSEKADGND